MRFLILMIIASLSLASCTPTTVDTAVQQNLPKICGAASQLHEAFLAISLSGEIKESTIRKEAIAWAGIETVCADPSNATAIGTLARVSAAYAIIISAMREAKGA